MRHPALLLTIGLALAAAPVSLAAPQPQMVRVILAPDPAAAAPLADPAVRSRVARILGTRANALGLTGATVSQGDRDEFVLHVPTSPPERVLRELARPGRLEFRWLRTVRSERNPKGKFQITYDRRPGELEGHLLVRDTRTKRRVNPRVVLDQSKIIFANDALRPTVRGVANPNDGAILLTFTLTPAGAEALKTFTRAHVGEYLAVVLDGTILTAPRIAQTIASGKGVIQGNFDSMEEAQALAAVLNSGALPVALRVVGTEALP